MQSSTFDHALAFIQRAHAGQTRKDGRPYWTHPVAVREILANELHISDRAANLAALLHDTVEDTPVTLEQLTAEFGADVASYVRFLTNKLPGESPEQAHDRYHAGLRTAPDVVRCIKAADRIHNLREMKDASADFRRKYLPETQMLIEMLAGCSAIDALKAQYAQSLARFAHEL